MEQGDRPCRLRCRTAFTTTSTDNHKYPFPLIPPLTPRFEKGKRDDGGDATCFSSRLSMDSTFSRHLSAGDAPLNDDHDRHTTTASTATVVTVSGDTIRKARSARTERTETTFTSVTSLPESSKFLLDGKSPEELEKLIRALKRKKEKLQQEGSQIPFNYKDLEAKMQAKIIEKLNRRSSALNQSVTSLDDSSKQLMQIGKDTEYPDSFTTFDTDLFFKSSQAKPKVRQVKPVLANFPKLQYFQAPLRRLPTPWHCRPGTPLQKIYGSVVKEMPTYTEKERQKLILQAVDNGHLYRKIKQAVSPLTYEAKYSSILTLVDTLNAQQSWYQRKEQLTDFKKHENFVRFRGPVANPDVVEGKKNKNMGTCFSFKPAVEEETQEYYDSTSICDEESPVPTATHAT